MIKAVFRKDGDDFIGFTINGHAEAAPDGEDIICAGVSSALMLTVNTITDFIKAEAEVDISPEKEGYAALTLNAPYSKDAALMIKSFHAHLEILEEEYGHINVRVKQ